MKSVAIVNPAAAMGRGERVWHAHAPALQRVLGDIELLTSEAPGQVGALARQAVADGASHLVLCGGDGTVGEAINALLADGMDLPRDLLLTPLPGGTANAVADNLGLTRGPEACAAALAQGGWVEMDVLAARCTGPEGGEIVHHALVAVSFGAVAEMLRAANEAGKLKRWGGRLVYHLAAARRGLSYPAFEVQVAFEGGAGRRRRLRAGIVANLPQAGGAPMAPEARHDDGLFDAVLIGDLPFLRRYVEAPARLWRGRIAQVRGIEIIRGRQIAITGRDDIPVDADGESIGKTPLAVDILPAALRFTVAPKGEPA